jgi:hypothetical protein
MYIHIHIYIITKPTYGLAGLYFIDGWYWMGFVVIYPALPGKDALYG